MNIYFALASAVLVLHLLFILWIAFGVLFTRARPLLRWLHLGSLVWGVLVEILSWPCPLTPAENWLRTRAGLGPYQGGFLLHYLDALVYPDVPPGLLTNLWCRRLPVQSLYLCRAFRRRHIAGW